MSKRQNLLTKKKDKIWKVNFSEPIETSFIHIDLSILGGQNKKSIRRRESIYAGSRWRRSGFYAGTQVNKKRWQQQLGVGDRRWVSDWRYNSELWGWQCRLLIFFLVLNFWIIDKQGKIMRESVNFWIEGRKDENGSNFRWAYCDFSKSFVKMTQNYKKNYCK